MTNKQQQHLEQLQVSPIYYYEYGVITVCLLIRDKQVLARGVAVCSPLDQFVKKVGRAKALGMALRALLRSESSEHISPRQFLGTHQQIHPLWEAEKFGYRSQYIPKLTDTEKQILAYHS